MCNRRSAKFGLRAVGERELGIAWLPDNDVKWRERKSLLESCRVPFSLFKILLNETVFIIVVMGYITVYVYGTKRVEYFVIS